MADKVQYTCHPLQKLRIGRVEFKNGVAELSAEDAERFDRTLAGIPLADRRIVKKISDSAALKVIEAHRATQTKAVLGGATSDIAGSVTHAGPRPGDLVLTESDDPNVEPESEDDPEDNPAPEPEPEPEPGVESKPKVKLPVGKK